MSLKRDAVLSIYTTYSRDIEAHRKIMEKQRKEYLFSSPQLPYRRHLVKWLRCVCEQIKVSYRTVHLAVYILDMFMEGHSIETDRLRFVALVCIMLAAKYEEMDSKIPKISELNKFDGFRYTNRDFIKLEGMILSFLGFRLSHPTVAHFAEYYTMFTVTPDDLKNLSHSLRRLAEISYSSVAEMMEVCLKEVVFVLFPPSIVAATYVLLTRRRLGLTPLWTSLLTDITSYTLQDLLTCANLVLRKLEEDKLKKEERNVQSPDHGYFSDYTP